MAHDRADWHSGGDYPADLPPENGGTHIGMFLAWAILNGLEGEIHHDGSEKELARVRKRKMTGREFLFRACDGKFWEDDLNDEGNAFARAYYLGRGGKGYGKYLDDYCEVLGVDQLPSVYHVEDTWANYAQVAAVLDRRYADWKKKRKPKGKVKGTPKRKPKP
jgi:hypothetical protein